MVTFTFLQVASTVEGIAPTFLNDYVSFFGLIPEVAYLFGLYSYSWLLENDFSFYILAYKICL